MTVWATSGVRWKGSRKPASVATSAQSCPRAARGLSELAKYMADWEAATACARGPGARAVPKVESREPR
eukprot:13359432-Alexandrium_andersonii.AAC.1